MGDQEGLISLLRDALRPFSAEGWTHLGMDLWPNESKIWFMDEHGLTMYGEATFGDFRKAAEAYAEAEAYLQT